MKNQLTLLLLIVLSGAYMFGQKIAPMDALGKTSIYTNSLLDVESSFSSPQAPSDPIGTVSSSAVTSLKIGEASNVYTYISLATNQVSTLPGLGTGGAVGFIHRQNIANCSGNNGQFRYTLSVDGGNTWKVGTSVSTPPSPPVNTCWGLGTLNSDVGDPTVTDPDIPGRTARYPNFGLFRLSNANDLDSLAAVFCGPVLQGTSTGWDGYLTGVATDVNSTPIVTDEQLHWQDDGSGNTTQFFCHSQVQVHPDSNIWYFLSRDFDPNGGTGNGAPGNDLFLNRGVYDNSTRQMTWTTTHSWSFNLTTTPARPDGISPIDPTIAFAPDGRKGYIAFISDLAGQGKDTTNAPIILETTDAGITWSAPQELDLHQFPQLIADIQEDTFWTDANQTDILWLEPNVSTAFNFDMEVDKNGIPHIFTLVGGNKTGSTDPNRADTEPGHGTISNLFRGLYDITKDQYGDWNMIAISGQNALRGYFGDLSAPATQSERYFAMDYHPQVGRSQDGSRMFFSWADTDTSINPPAPGPVDDNGNPVSMANYAPNLHTFGLNIDNNTVTNITNWTADDLTWTGRAIGPRMANVSLPGTNKWTLPITVMSLDGGSAINFASFHYFSDIVIDETDFVDPARFFYNCKENPYANTMSSTDATCGMMDGTATVTISGGIAPYTYEWNDPNSSAGITANGLAAGIYTVAISDDFGCVDSQQVIINDVGAAVLSIDQASIADPNCFNTADGAATVTATGGTGMLTYAWSPSNETTAAATMLPGGTSTVVVTDGAGCVSRAIVTLNTPSAIELTVIGTDVICYGEGNGTVTAIASGGSGTLSYIWNNDASLDSATLIGLEPGPYQVEVSDENSCKVSSSVIVAEPDSLEIFEFTVNTRNGRSRIEAKVRGGNGDNQGGYKYSWVNGDGIPSGTGPAIFNRPPGRYIVTVTDLNGCTAKDSVDVLTGLEDEIASGISTFDVFPNPVRDIAFVNISLDRMETATITLMDIAGKTQHASEVSGRDMRVQIDVGGFASGLYLVRLSTERGSAVRKLIVR
ncbi:MAG: T9SS type A sorting domain-containing protein [Bacteroidia bacterium]